MISSLNAPTNYQASNDDFTIEYYRDLLKIAKLNYIFVSYDSIPWGQKFILWRHDCDFSLNRAYAMARLEAENGIKATYFLNPHSDFYNLYERNQYLIIREIIGMGHQIGVHFDASFYDCNDQSHLSVYVSDEANILENLFEIRPKVFSFHNPLAQHLLCDMDSYGGLINCYSHRFKTEVGYCSDSNGYWRFRPLREVLEKSEDKCLQVLTHPGWWQESSMPPRQRIFRSAFGRAHATMDNYDFAISANGRENLSGLASALFFLHDTRPDLYRLMDYLWMSGEMTTLFLELWRLHEFQITELCRLALYEDWQVPDSDLNEFFEHVAINLEGWRLFSGVFGMSSHETRVLLGDIYQNLHKVRRQLMQGRSICVNQQLEEGCVFLCDIISSLARWGMQQSIPWNGLSRCYSVSQKKISDLDINRISQENHIQDQKSQFKYEKWQKFLADMLTCNSPGLIV